VYGEDDDHYIPSEDDGDYDDLLNQLEFPFWRKPLRRNELRPAGPPREAVSPLIVTTYDDLKNF
jgi:hypothetical protein